MHRRRRASSSLIILLACSTAPRACRVASIAAAFLVAAISWCRPDPLQPVAEVEGIFPLALSVSPLLASAAALALAVASLSPLVCATLPVLRTAPARWR
jgi:hypothetical protein